MPYWLCLWSDFNHRSFLIIIWTGLGYLTRGKGKSGYQFETAKWRPYFTIKFWTMSRITIVSCCIHFRRMYLWFIMNLLKMEISSHEFVKKLRFHHKKCNWSFQLQLHVRNCLVRSIRAKGPIPIPMTYTFRDLKWAIKISGGWNREDVQALLHSWCCLSWHVCIYI